MKQERQIELEGGIPLFKLHSSLNWALETGVLSLYQDNRPAFRHGSDAQIVPPILEKEVPPWLAGVWNGARQALALCPTWIVCGYSLPLYDHAITQLFSDAAAVGTVARITLLDSERRDSPRSLESRSTASGDPPTARAAGCSQGSFRLLTSWCEDPTAAGFQQIEAPCYLTPVFRRIAQKRRAPLGMGGKLPRIITVTFSVT
jgi:hypothetical protein